MLKKILCIVLSTTLVNVTAYAGGDPMKAVNRAVTSRAQEIAAEQTPEEVSAHFEELAVLLLTKEHESARASMTVDELGKAGVEYAALGQVISPEAKKVTYLKLFGTRGVSPFYGQVNQDEFSALFLLVIPVAILGYVLASFIIIPYMD